MTPSRPGFTLTEMLVAMAIVALIGAITVPLVRRGLQASHQAGCLNNLRQIGTGLELYLQDNGQRMPNIEAGRRSKSEETPVLETALEPYLDSPAVFHCPADREQFAATGSSYLWNPTQSDRRRNQLMFLGEEGDLPHVPLVVDKESWHPKGPNYLYADLSASDDVRFAAGPQAR